MNIRHTVGTFKHTQFIPPLFLIGVITLIFGTIYVVGQQVVRMSANDPQIQYAEDLARVLSSSEDPVLLLSAFFPQKIDISESRAPYIIVYNEQGVLTVSSATLHGKNPQIPRGVFDYVRSHGEDRFTWQPEQGVRSAVVVTHFNTAAIAGQGTATSTHPTSGFIVVGRSLQEIEIREDNLLYTVALGWVLSCLVVIAYGYVRNLLTK